MDVIINRSDIQLIAETDLERAFFKHYGKDGDDNLDVFRINTGGGDCIGMCIRQKTTEA